MKYVNQKILVFLFVSFTCHKLHSQATNGNTANNILIVIISLVGVILTVPTPCLRKQMGLIECA